MDKLRREYGMSCALHFCVLEPEETIPATKLAVEGHKTAAFLPVSAGTLLSECMKKLRATARVGHAAQVHGLDPQAGAWMALIPEFMSYACQENQVFHFKLVITPGAIDYSQDWARTVLQPFPYSVVELEGLRQALAEPLPLPIPVGDATYASLRPDVAPLFTPSKSYPAETVSCHTTAFMISRPTPGASGNLLQSTWDMAFASFWMDLLPFLEVQVVHLNRNVVDNSDTSTESVAPDLMLWVLNRLCVKFEEKHETLAAARRGLIDRICSLPVNYYGQVQWIIGVGLAYQDMGVWAMRKGQQPDELSGALSMGSQADKAACLRLSMNFLRVALSLTSVYNKLTYLPVPFSELQPASYGSQEQITRRFRIRYPTVTKTIEPWSEHEEQGFTTATYVEEAFKCAIKPGARLVKAMSIQWRNNRYKVVLQPVGFEQRVSTEDELRGAIRDVLKGLRVLHEAGLVHRDVRWKNILNTELGEWMLIDMETVWACDHKPKCCSLRAWDEKTLVNGRYTVQSDLYLVGKLMHTVLSLSPAGSTLKSKLLNHEFASAHQALAHDYLSC